MAYALELDRQCSETRCSKRATHEVRNNRNSVMGYYCQKHADELVAELKADGQ